MPVRRRCNLWIATGKSIILLSLIAAPTMSFAAKNSKSDSSLDPFTLFIIFILTGLSIGGIFIYILRKTVASSIDRSPPPDPAALEAQNQRLMKLSPQLVPAEHALRLGEDHDLRALLERATEFEHAAYNQLEAARSGSARALEKAARMIDEIEPLAKQIHTRVEAIDPAAIAALGRKGSEISKRSGCFFCARPLANAEYRRMVPLRSQQGNADVLACPNCADLIVRGEAPETTILGGEGGPRHWSEEPGFDPYQHHHVPHPAATHVPAWRFTPARPFADLALLAAGGALGAGAVYAAIQPFDLDVASKIGLAREAARIAAKRARDNSSDNDNSWNNSSGNTSWSSSSRDSS